MIIFHWEINCSIYKTYRHYDWIDESNVSLDLLVMNKSSEVVCSNSLWSRYDFGEFLRILDADTTATQASEKHQEGPLREAVTAVAAGLLSYSLERWRFVSGISKTLGFEMVMFGWCMGHHHVCTARDSSCIAVSTLLMNLCYLLAILDGPVEWKMAQWLVGCDELADWLVGYGSYYLRYEASCKHVDQRPSTTRCLPAI